MIDRLVHHAEIAALKDDSYRPRDRDLARPARDDGENRPRAARNQAGRLAVPASPTRPKPGVACSVGEKGASSPALDIVLGPRPARTPREASRAGGDAVALIK